MVYLDWEVTECSERKIHKRSITTIEEGENIFPIPMKWLKKMTLTTLYFTKKNITMEDFSYLFLPTGPKSWEPLRRRYTYYL